MKVVPYQGLETADSRPQTSVGFVFVEELARAAVVGCHEFDG